MCIVVSLMIWMKKNENIFSNCSARDEKFRLRERSCNVLLTTQKFSVMQSTWWFMSFRTETWNNTSLWLIIFTRSICLHRLFLRILNLSDSRKSNFFFVKLKLKCLFTKIMLIISISAILFNPLAHIYLPTKTPPPQHFPLPSTSSFHILQLFVPPQHLPGHSSSSASTFHHPPHVFLRLLTCTSLSPSIPNSSSPFSQLPCPA